MNHTSEAAGDRNLLVIEIPTMVSTLGSGMSGAIAPVALTGPISLDPIATPTPGSAATPPIVNPLRLVNATGTPIPASSISATFGEITNPALIPPIPRLTLMFTIERERTN
jgi:hypothetical protein